MDARPLKEILEELLVKYPNIVFLIDGDSAQGVCDAIIKANQDKFIFVKDYMGTGTGTPEILSAEFIECRAKEFDRPWDDTFIYTPVDYERDYAAELRKLSQRKGAEIVIVQFDCHISHIFQLTMQAYIEQIGIADHIIRVVFCEKQKGCNTELICNKYDYIPIAGSHCAYCQLVCDHKPANLSGYLIPKTAVKSYLDIHLPAGKLTQYVKTVSATYDNPFWAASACLCDFARLGLGTHEFLRIAYSVLQSDARYYDVTQMWKRKLKEFYE